ncbi:TetR/AcrR family transcriptional regulator C-terminal domain-containing protein [Umezawaea endophytica]|uniref:TetR/AcrR family transcriptional regulator C-terminal domain-containing protein n=1 Tax=Umezawaea endophytica TaxID=1654476 RepID=A0A9X2VW32_9PSEU|nr:TetR/AcrR family transcriptional regulator C-terminal domain-containing protein [Umezawaea endophytica]MCS7483906.1 TetR/AcrR family transcriptional regulator C-terminal domain-containing protein [Umezawaea endophytica]
MAEDPPYLRIAAELKRRIQEGELPPGSRVPSVRGIAAEWGVAMATATKVVAALSDEGLVRAVPRVGTVVATPAPSRRSVPRRDSAARLTRARVVDAAIDIADEQGFDGLSMRSVAADLGVPTMSLYKHVRGRDELAMLMADTVFAQHRLPAVPPPTWRAQLELVARMQWAAYRAHPWLPKLLSLTRPQPMPNLLHHAEWVMRALEGHGQSPTVVFHAHITLFGYVRGTALSIEPEAQAEADTGLSADQWVDENGDLFGPAIDSGTFPAFARVVGTPFDFDLDDVFEFGLQRLLDGYAALFR